MKKVATLALMAIIFIGFSACTSIDEEYYDDNTSMQQMWDGTWETTSFQASGLWMTPYDSGQKLRIVFHGTTYEACYETHGSDSYGSPRSVGTSYYGGDFEVRGSFIYCYDGNTRNERIRLEILHAHSNQLEARVDIVKRNESCHAMLTRTN